MEINKQTTINLGLALGLLAVLLGVAYNQGQKDVVQAGYSKQLIEFGEEFKGYRKDRKAADDKLSEILRNLDKRVTILEINTK